MNVKLAPSRRVAGISAIGALALTLAACGGSSSGDGDETTESNGTNESTELSGTIAGSGASSQESAVQGWLAGFMEANPDATVTYDPTGSGTGREQFINGTVQFAGSDAALDADELAAAQERCGGTVIEAPLYISPIAVVYNVPELNDTNINLGPDTIARIFAGEITNWNDPAIVEANPDAELPDLDIVPVNRSDDSGTTENFTEYLAAAAPDTWTHEPSGLWPIEGSQSGAQTSGVLGVVEAAEGTIGYVDASRVGELGSVAVGVGEEFVPFSPEAAATVVDVSEPAADATDTILTIDLARDTQESGAYPIVLISYSLACGTYDNEEHASLVQGYLSYVASEEGQERAAQPDVAGSAPISDSLRERVNAALETISAG
ncbi:phosphate ABC transporter substrate-binding protein PstS [Ruania halotolerans]|uniref:phosphate ABC transporter substrate-binding protein PstS n=1 Tax=Ruania halotolerans TaxID=2897773 RepID=UPI001E2923A6|nr:phosphate ABC transporter substrate-binding protein PstS [Ruania halotolerans]UFU05930.1 phosphate ABC transporter substrate-binding protein PstS [Ruania halotolerans]